MTALALEQLTVVLGERPVVDRVDLDVAEGEWLALIGPNGAGKTTLLRAVARLVPYSGSIALHGRDTRRMHRTELSRLVAVVPQNPVTPPWMTVAEYVLLGRTPHLGRLAKEGTHDREIAAAALARLDLLGFRDRLLGTLSGGERQRVVVARALAQEARLVLLDEPTAALDIGHQQQALELLDLLRAESASRSSPRCTTSRSRPSTRIAWCCSTPAASSPTARRARCSRRRSSRALRRHDRGRRRARADRGRALAAGGGLMALTVLLGGARSGKSRLAIETATAAGAPVTFVATGEARDEEMAERIAKHRAERPAAWATVEEPLALEAVLRDVDPAQTVIVDCLTLWVANLLERDGESASVLESARGAAAAAAERPGLTLAISNEVGLGIVPATPLGREFRDLLGSVNRVWVDASAEAMFVVAGPGTRTPVIRPVDEAARAAALVELDRKTKPRGSLGRIEALAAQVAAIRGSVEPEPLRAAIVVAAADHGVAAEGVSAYPQEVTRQMLATFAAGGAAISVLARAAGAELVVVDAGVVEPYSDPAIRDLRLGPGTANAALGPAMTRELAAESIERGRALARDLGATAVALGDMGIANTTSASAICCALLGREPAEMCGPGTGLDAAGVAHKAAVVERMLDANSLDAEDPLGVLASVGGFEIGILAGVALGAASERAVVVLDGFITGAAALVAAQFEPALGGYLVASHRSPEPGHTAVLEALGLEPLLDLGLRLGEGSGAALALPLVAAARAILVEMATFESAHVTDTGR